MACCYHRPELSVAFRRKMAQEGQVRSGMSIHLLLIKGMNSHRNRSRLIIYV